MGGSKGRVLQVDPVCEPARGPARATAGVSPSRPATADARRAAEGFVVFTRYAIASHSSGPDPQLAAHKLPVSASGTGRLAIPVTVSTVMRPVLVRDAAVVYIMFRPPAAQLLALCVAHRSLGSGG